MSAAGWPDGIVWHPIYCQFLKKLVHASVPKNFTEHHMAWRDQAVLHVGRQLVEIFIPVHVHQLLVVDAELLIWVDGHQDRSDVRLRNKDQFRQA